MAASSQPVILFKLGPEWGLPSLSIPCLQVEAYLRLAEIPFAVEECATPSASPTGRVPALDTSSDLVGVTPTESRAGAAGEAAAAGRVLEYIRRNIRDLDRALSPENRAELVAFTALLESKLVPAILYSTWMEDAAFKQHTSRAYGRHQPFPVGFFSTISTRREIRRSFGDANPTDIYAAGGEALDAFAAKLTASSPGPYLFGSSPSSLDALLFGCLSFLRSAPVVHPELQQHLVSREALGRFLSALSESAFATPAPVASETAGFEWSQTGTASGDQRYNKAAASATLELNRKGKIWLACATAVIVGYIVFGGQYIQIGYGDDDYGEEEFEE